jgi:hypothetical protein
MLSNSNFLIVGLVRDCEKTIKADVSVLHKALSDAKNLYWLLIESDSSDKTINVLAEMKIKFKNFDYITLGELKKISPLRTDRISLCRNTYLEEIKKNEKYKNIDYVIVSDFDGINTALNSDALMSCFERNDWGVCAANQAGPYYDIWALRHKDWCPNDCFSQYRFLIKNNKNAFLSFYISIISRMIKISSASNWIEVDSAFGGLAIYRRDVLLHGKYNGLTSLGNEVSEHVSFHGDIRSKGHKIFINPKFINSKRVGHVNDVIKKAFLLLILGNKGFESLKSKIKF